jgi:hypothetical protein
MLGSGWAARSREAAAAPAEARNAEMRRILGNPPVGGDGGVGEVGGSEGGGPGGDSDDAFQSLSTIESVFGSVRRSADTATCIGEDGLPGEGDDDALDSEDEAALVEAERLAEARRAWLAEAEAEAERSRMARTFSANLRVAESLLGEPLAEPHRPPPASPTIPEDGSSEEDESHVEAKSLGGSGDAGAVAFDDKSLDLGFLPSHG